MECYRFEKIAGQNPLFAHIDATYVIHLENNGRLESVKKELLQYYPSKNTCIVYNKGFRNCDKKLPKYETQYDLVDANLFIFRDAQKKQYKNILILEDDFFFHKEVRNHSVHIDEYIENKQDNDEFMYLLGCLPILSFPRDMQMIHYTVPVGGGTHAVIYSKLYREQLMTVNQEDIMDWDAFQLSFRRHNRIMYHMPLCYQLFPRTENSTNWGNQDRVLKFICTCLFELLQFLRLDVQVDPGYPICYAFSKSILWIVFMSCILLVYYKNKRIIKHWLQTLLIQASK